MTNEEHLEEILHESHQLGFDKKIFEVVKMITKENPKIQRVDAYDLALQILKKNENIVSSKK